MGKIIRDERYTNTIWCLCDNAEEYRHFAKELFLLKGIEESWGFLNEEKSWIDDVFMWCELFGVDLTETYDATEDSYEYSVPDVLSNECEMKEKPANTEYPVIVYHEYKSKAILWVPLNKLIRG